MQGRILITGATGFIGRAVLQRLAGLEQCVVRAVVRPGSNHHVDGVERVELSLRDDRAAVAAVSGCDYIVHLAFDAADLPGNEVILRNLAEAGLAAGVKKFVHMSSVAVYEPLGDAVLAETAMPGRPETAYAATKQALERSLDGFVARGLPVTILQPTIVYGPNSRTWVTDPVRAMLRGKIALPVDGQGRANLVYVTDVAESIMRALEANLQSGERILISGDDAPSWGDYYGWIDRLVGRSSLYKMPEDAPLAGNAYKLKRLTGLLADPEGPLIKRLPSAVRQRLLGLLHRRAPRGRPVFYPPSTLAKLYASSCVADIGKARRLLNYAPHVDFARGQALTSEYIRAMVDRDKLANGPR